MGNLEIHFHIPARCTRLLFSFFSNMRRVRSSFKFQFSARISLIFLSLLDRMIIFLHPLLNFDLFFKKLSFSYFYSPRTRKYRFKKKKKKDSKITVGIDLHFHPLCC